MENILQLIEGLHLNIDPEYIRQELEHIESASSRLGHNSNSSDYSRLGGIVHIYNLKQRAPQNIAEYERRMKRMLHPHIAHYMLTHEKLLNGLLKEYDHLNYRYYYGGASIFGVQYSLKERFNGPAIETPTQVYLRAAIQINKDHGFGEVARCFIDMASGDYTLATPALVAAGTNKNQTASCYIIDVDDNIQSIANHAFSYPTIISSHGGGLGINLSNLRHSEISTRGMSKGVIPVSNIINRIMLYADQRDTRKGAANLSLTCHHIDVQEFIGLTAKIGTETNKEPFDMFTTFMTNWLFIKRLREDGEWTLFCPAKTPELKHKYGKEWIKRYIEYEQDTTIPAYAKKRVKASDILDQLLLNRLQTGSPYSVNIDAINMKNPLGDKFYINNPNLCLEVMQYADENEIAVCNLGSICLNRIVKQPYKYEIPIEDNVDFQRLAHITRSLVTTLNRLIDTSMNSVDKAQNAALKRRSLGIGVQGFADLLYMLDLHFKHEKTARLNKQIAACIYWNALARSMDMALERGSPYEGFEHSHAAQGKLQFDLWRDEFLTLQELDMVDEKWRRYEDDEPLHPSEWGQCSYTLCNGEVVEPTWDSLKSFIQKYGLLNAHLTCQQPTSNTSVINDNFEMKEGPTYNVYTREFNKMNVVVVNKHMERDLRDIGLFNEYSIQHIRTNQGSLQDLKHYVQANRSLFPHYSDSNEARLDYVVEKYRTMFEIDNRTMLKLTADSGRYICQSQSTNVYISEASLPKLRGIFYIAEALGLKTTTYYTRVRSIHTPGFTKNENKKKIVVCTDEVCTSCCL